MIEVQVTKQSGKPAFHVLPAALWERIRGKGLELDEDGFLIPALTGLRCPGISPFSPG